MKNEVSICIPTYNQPDYLKNLLDSILIQNFKNYEVIISDDSTNNETETLIQEYRNKFETFKYFRNTPSLGSPKSWNEAIKNANGTYIKVMHSDDWFSNSDSLEQFLKLITSIPNCAFAFSGAYSCDANKKIKRQHSVGIKQIKKIKKSPDYLFGRNIIGAPSATIYRNDIKNKFYDEKLKWVVDVEQYIRILNENRNFAFTALPLVSVTDGAAHQSNHSSVGVASVELFEWTYLYTKLREAEKLHNKIFIWLYLINVLQKCKISDINQLKAMNFDPNERNLLKRLLKIQKILILPIYILKYIKRKI